MRVQTRGLRPVPHQELGALRFQGESVDGRSFSIALPNSVWAAGPAECSGQVQIARKLCMRVAEVQATILISLSIPAPTDLYVQMYHV